MRVFGLVCIGVAALTFVVQAQQNTWSVFSVGPALPLGSTAAPTLGPPGASKDLGTGWNGAWTFFGLPFSKSGDALAGLGFGGSLSYSRWVRDSTLSETVFMGTQAIVRYYIPPVIKPFDLFVQVGGGMLIGEHGFTDPDTLSLNSQPTSVLVTKGVINPGASFNIGIDWDVLEITPAVTAAFTKGKTSAWFSIDAAMKL
jgi:hypothetical protein